LGPVDDVGVDELSGSHLLVVRQRLLAASVQRLVEEPGHLTDVEAVAAQLRPRAGCRNCAAPHH